MKTTQGPVAVVGGGIAGLYCCYHLAMHGQQVVLYEYQDRLGGRIESWDAGHGLYADFGPMRIEPDRQPLLGSLLEELGFQYRPRSEAQVGDLTDFSEYTSPDGQRSDAHVAPDAEEENSLETLTQGLIKVCMSTKRTVWNRSAQQVLRQMANPHPDVGHQTEHFKRFLAQLNEEDFVRLRKSGCFGGIPLWDMGFWNLMSDVLPHDALTRMRHYGSFYHLLGDNPNAVEWTIFWLRALNTSEHLRGIKGGMAQIIERLTMRPTSPPLNRYVTIQRRMKLLQIVPASHERVRLRFENRKGDTANRYAHRLILALPKRSLEHLVSSLPTVANEIEAVFGFPLIKCFFVVDRPWWSADRGANEFATVVPTRELHWWRTDDGTRGLVMVYADRPAAHFWADYLPRPQEQLKAKVWKSMKQAKRLAEKFRQYVYANGVKRSKYSDENLVACAIRDWSREPFGGGAHAWRPGRKSWEVMRRLKQFALVDGGVRNVHICGEAYSDYQGFIEGSLRSADNVLKVLRIRR